MKSSSGPWTHINKTCMRLSAPHGDAHRLLGIIKFVDTASNNLQWCHTGSLDMTEWIPGHNCPLLTSIDRVEAPCPATVQANSPARGLWHINQLAKLGNVWREMVRHFGQTFPCWMVFPQSWPFPNSNCHAFKSCRKHEWSKLGVTLHLKQTLREF